MWGLAQVPPLCSTINSHEGGWQARNVDREEEAGNVLSEKVGRSLY